MDRILYNGTIRTLDDQDNIFEADQGWKNCVSWY